MAEEEYPDEPAPGTEKPEEHKGTDGIDHPPEKRKREHFGPKL